MAQLHVAVVLHVPHPAAPQERCIVVLPATATVQIVVLPYSYPPLFGHCLVSCSKGIYFKISEEPYQRNYNEKEDENCFVRVSVNDK